MDNWESGSVNYASSTVGPMRFRKCWSFLYF